MAIDFKVSIPDSKIISDWSISSLVTKSVGPNLPYSLVDYIKKVTYQYLWHYYIPTREKMEATCVLNGTKVWAELKPFL